MWLNSIGRLIIPLSLAWLRIDWSISAARTKRRGERGTPCLTPLLQWTIFPGNPLRRTEEFLEFKTDLIHSIHLFPNPYLDMICKSASCSILLNVFSKSSLRMINSFLDLW